jgi:hypothetical protein
MSRYEQYLIKVHQYQTEHPQQPQSQDYMAVLHEMDEPAACLVAGSSEDPTLHPGSGDRPAAMAGG